MSSVKKKYNCDNIIIAGEMTGGVSLEKLVTRLPEPVGHNSNEENKNSREAPQRYSNSLSRSISLVAPNFSSYKSQGRGRSSSVLFAGGLKAFKKPAKKDKNSQKSDKYCNASAENLLSEVSYSLDSNGPSNMRMSRELQQSCTHLPSGSSSFPDNHQGMMRHSSTSNVLTASVPPDTDRSLGTLQRLARSSTNLISRSRSCLNVETLQRFRKNFFKGDKFSKDTLGKRNKVHTPSSHTPEDEMKSPTTSMLSLDLSDNQNRVEPLTSSSNLTLSSLSKMDSVYPETTNSSAIVGTTNSTNVPTDVISKGIDHSAQQSNNKVEKNSTVSLSSSTDHKRKNLKRNPSMLYYFRKNSLRLKSGDGEHNSSNLSLKEVYHENLLNKSLSCETSEPSNLFIESHNLLNNQLYRNDKEAAKMNNSKSYQNFESTNNRSNSIDSENENSERSLLNSSICDPTQFHGPEFVVRSRQLPKHLAVLQEKTNSGFKKPVTVVLVSGQKLLIQCNPSSTSLSHLMQTVSSECGVPGNLQTVFGLALLQEGHFLYPPHHSNLAKLAPKSWLNKRSSKNDSSESFTLYYRLAYYHRGIESHSRSLCYLVYLQLRQDMLEGRLHSASPQQLLYMASLALRAEMTDWSFLYQEVDHIILKYYLPDFLLAKLREMYEIKTGDLTVNDADETSQSEENDLTAEEIVRVLYSYDGKLRTVSVWGAIKRFISTAQHTLYYGAHYYAVQQHQKCSGPQRYIGVSSNGLLLLNGFPNNINIREATLHSWDSLKSFRKWSDGRLKLIVNCNKCCGSVSSANEANAVTWKSCVGALRSTEEQTNIPSATHKITLKISSVLGCKCLVHLIKLHKKLVQESNSLPSTSGSQFDMSSVCTSLSNSCASLPSLSIPFGGLNLARSSTSCDEQSSQSSANISTPSTSLSHHLETAFSHNPPFLASSSVTSTLRQRNSQSNSHSVSSKNETEDVLSVNSESELLEGQRTPETSRVITPNYKSVITPLKLPDFKSLECFKQEIHDESEPVSPVSPPHFKSDFAKCLSSSNLKDKTYQSEKDKRYFPDKENSFSFANQELKLNGESHSNYKNRNVPMNDAVDYSKMNGRRNLQSTEKLLRDLTQQLNISDNSNVTPGSLCTTFSNGLSSLQVKPPTEAQSGDLSDLLYSSCLKFSELCDNLVEESNSKLKGVLSEKDADFENLNLNSSFDMMIESIMDEDEFEKEFEEMKMVKFDVQDDLEDQQKKKYTESDEGIFLKKVAPVSQSEEQDEELAAIHESVSPRQIGKICEDEMDVDFFLDDGPDFKSKIQCLNNTVTSETETKSENVDSASSFKEVVRVKSFKKTPFDSIPEDEEISSSKPLDNEDSAGKIASATLRPSTLPLFADFSKKELGLQSPKRSPGVMSLCAKKMSSKTAKPMKLSPYQPSCSGLQTNSSEQTIDKNSTYQTSVCSESLINGREISAESEDSKAVRSVLLSPSKSVIPMVSSVQSASSKSKPFTTNNASPSFHKKLNGSSVGCQSPNGSQSPLQHKLGISGIHGSPLRCQRSSNIPPRTISSPSLLDEAKLCKSLPSSPHKTVSPSVRMGTRVTASAVVRNKQRTEQHRTIDWTNGTSSGSYPNSCGSLESLITNEDVCADSSDSNSRETTHRATNNRALTTLYTDDTKSSSDFDSVDDDAIICSYVLVPVVVVRGPGGSLGMVVVQGTDYEEEEINTSTDSIESGGGEVRRVRKKKVNDKTLVVVQSVMEGGAAYNKLIPGDQLLWVNGHNLENLPYQMCVDLLRDPSTDVLSFVVTRPHSDHQLLLKRQYMLRKTSLDSYEKLYHRFGNELSPDDYYTEKQHSESRKERQNRHNSLGETDSIVDRSIDSGSNKVHMHVKYPGPSTVITIPVVNGHSSLDFSSEEETTTTKLKRSESRGEIRSANAGPMTVRRSHTFCGRRGLNEITSGKVTCVVMNASPDQ